MYVRAKSVAKITLAHSFSFALSLSVSLLTVSLSPSLTPPLFVFSLLGVSRVVCGVRAARCLSRRALGVSRVVRSRRVVSSLASSRHVSCRVVCRLVVRRPAARSLASSRRESSRVVCRLVVRRPAARCQLRLVRSRGASSCSV